MLAGFDDKSAQAICTLAFSEGPGHEPIIFQGRTKVSNKQCRDKMILYLKQSKGKLVPARGPATFGGYSSCTTMIIANRCLGWDPAFEYEGRTYAEMTKDEKNMISHRAKALAKLSDWLQSQQA